MLIYHMVIHKKQLWLTHGMLIITELDLFGIVVYPKTENLYLFQWLYLRVVSSILKLIGSFILYMLFGA